MPSPAADPAPPVSDARAASRRAGRPLGALRPSARRRHSRTYSGFVQVAKWVLPVIALGLIALVALWPHLRNEDVRFRIGFAAIQSNVDDEASLLNPRYVGTDEHDQPYSITADIAKKVGGEGLDTRVGLELPKADITLEDGTWLVLTAENGVYVRRDKTLELTGNVNLFHDSGYEFRTAKTTVDLSKGLARGNVPVNAQGPFGTLVAEGFILINRGRTVVFTGKSKLVLNPNSKRPGR